MILSEAIHMTFHVTVNATLEVLNREECPVTDSVEKLYLIQTNEARMLRHMAGKSRATLQLCSTA